MSHSRSWMPLVLCLLGAGLVPARGGAAEEAAGPVITVPKDNQHIGQEGDPNCPQPDQPCNRVRVEGKVPAGTVPFLAVGAVLAAPSIWIQPPIHGVKADGTVTGIVHIGESTVGIGEHFKLYLFACERADRFHDGEVIQQLPKDCALSEPVKIYRIR